MPGTGRTGRRVSRGRPGARKGTLARVRGPKTARERTYTALLGCAVGDACGEALFGAPDAVRAHIAARELPDGPLRWTDDTLQASSVVHVLTQHGGDLPQDALVANLAEHVCLDRGYGHGSRDLLFAVRAGADWRVEAPRTFGGRGSWGNGAAMRAAPIGAWWCGDPSRAADLARRQAEVTHAHPEAAAGAAAVAAVASVLVTAQDPDPAWLLGIAADVTGPGRVREGLVAARGLLGAPVDEAAAVLGTGREAAAWDTVPFALWSAVQSPHDLGETFWRTVSGLGDRDTTCAIACALATCHTGMTTTLEAWLSNVEPVPGWA